MLFYPTLIKISVEKELIAVELTCIRDISDVKMAAHTRILLTY